MGNTNVSQLGRGILPVYSSGGTAALRFWAYNGTTASADGDNFLNQMMMPWNGRVRYGEFFSTNDPGAVIVGVHINRSLTALFTNTFTPTGGDRVTQFRLQGAFSASDEIAFSVDPANDPGQSYMAIAVEYDSAVL